MYKFVAITDESVADGFRLGGVEVTSIGSVEEAHEALVRMMADDDIGIIALDERYEVAIDERLQRKIDAVYRPVIVILPLREELDIEAFINDRMKSRIRQAVGFDITLSKGA
ncbi:MAG: V-type ATP synthase subunit F [Actinomycetia bacterium]|nr:V-type ATP synthase subunit F [Actinomycetes bacterium]